MIVSETANTTISDDNDTTWSLMFNAWILQAGWQEW